MARRRFQWSSGAFMLLVFAVVLVLMRLEFHYLEEASKAELRQRAEEARAERQREHQRLSDIGREQREQRARERHSSKAEGGFRARRQTEEGRKNRGEGSAARPPPPSSLGGRQFRAPQANKRQSMAADDGILETMGEPKRAAFPLPVRAEDAALRPVGEEGGREDRDMEERDGDVEEEEMEEEDEEDMLVGDEGVNYEEVAGAAGEAVGGTFEERMMLLLPVVMKGISMHHGFERLVLNQQAMDMGEKLLKRARLTRGEDLRPLLPESDIASRYERCALVGNSGLLLQQHAGLAIDKYDAVLRLNNAPTQGFQQYVGSRTTFRAINNRWTRTFSKTLAKEGRKAALRLVPPDSRRTTTLLCFGSGVFKTFVSLRKNIADRQVLYIAPEITGYAKQAFKAMRKRMERLGFGPYSGGHTMPSGFEGLVFMMQICGELHLYGFDPQTDKDVKYHYFDEITPWEGVHSFGFSFDFLRVLHHANLIRLCSPRYVNNTGCPKEEIPKNEYSSLWGED